MSVDWHDAIGVVAAIVAMAALIPYIRSIPTKSYGTGLSVRELISASTPTQPGGGWCH